MAQLRIETFGLLRAIVVTRDGGLAMDYQRRIEREAVTGEATLTWEHDGVSLRSEVRIRNLSGWGLQAECWQPVRTGVVAFVSGRQFECYGEVRYCVPAYRGYRVGIEFRKDPYQRCFETDVRPS